MDDGRYAERRQCVIEVIPAEAFVNVSTDRTAAPPRTSTTRNIGMGSVVLAQHARRRSSPESVYFRHYICRISERCLRGAA